MCDPRATLGLAALYVRTGDPAAWDAFESWHLCAETRVGAARWAAAVQDAVTPLAAQSNRALCRARHVVDTLGDYRQHQQRLLLRF